MTDYDETVGGLFADQRGHAGEAGPPVVRPSRLGLTAGARATVPPTGGTGMTQILDPEVSAALASGYEPEPYEPLADETVQCPNCQCMNAPDASYCDQCGLELEGRTDVMDNDEGAAAGDTLAVEQSGEDLGGKPNKGTPADKRLKANKDKAKASTPNSVAVPETLASTDNSDAGVDRASLPVMQETPEWRGVLVVEGEATGDGREFADGALQWATPPLPLRWQKVDSHGGMPTNETVQVGTIQRVWRADGQVWGEGVWDKGADNEDAAAASRRNAEGSLTGISIDADDITDADIEYVFPEGEEGEEDDLFMLLFAAPERVIFHSARIRAATLCDIPAFVEAQIHAIPAEEMAALAASAALVADLALGAVNSHTTATSDGSWDGAANEAKLNSPLSVATAKKAYAWIDDSAVQDGEVPKSGCKFIHHEVSADGIPGDANLTACSTGIGVLNGGRGGTTLSDTDRQGVYDHLAKHLRDGDQTPPPLNTTTHDVVVAGPTVTSWRPPRDWFENPNLGQVMPIMVTESGRVYGHAAQWGQCHLGYMSECVMPPFEELHDHFLTGEVICDDGSRVAVGQITAGLEHADLHLSASRAKQQYENTDAVVCDIITGNDKHGIWVAGAIRPWAHEARVHALRASGQVSPDWRRVGGALRMVALLTVNTSGYTVARARSYVASGVVQTLVSSGMVTVRTPQVTEEDLDRRAMKLMQRQLAARVHGSGKE